MACCRGLLTGPVAGSMKGKIVMDEDVPLRDPNMLNLVSEVSTRYVRPLSVRPLRARPIPTFLCL